jgi:hypothetical protein
MSAERRRPAFTLTDNILGWELIIGVSMLGGLSVYGFHTVVVNFNTWITDFEYATHTVYPLNWIPVAMLAALLGTFVMLCGSGVMITVAVFVMKWTESPLTPSTAKSEIMAYMSKHYHTWTASREVEWTELPFNPDDEPSKGMEPGSVYRLMFYAPVRSRTELAGFFNRTIEKYSAFQVANFKVEEETVLQRPALAFSFTYSLIDSTKP